MHTDARPSKSHRSKPSFKGFWNWRAKDFKAFLSTLLVKPTFEVPPSTRTGGCSNSTHLQTCCERALDAHTVEDAIFWHSEVINELSVEIYSISATSWSDERKQRTLMELMDLQNRHGIILQRLTGIVSRNEQLVWQPVSMLKK